MDNIFYYLVNRITGTRFGKWSSRAAAECYRNTLDDMMDWDIDYGFFLRYGKINFRKCKYKRP